MTENERRLLKCNDLLRSAKAIADRNGADTNWQTWGERLDEALKEQHAATNTLRAQSGNVLSQDC